MTTARRGETVAAVSGGRLRSMLRFFTNMTVFFFGGSFLGISLLLVSGELRGSASDYVAIAGGMCIGMAFGPNFRPRVFIAAYLGATLGGVAAVAGLRGLAALAATGVYGSDKFEWSYVNTENYLAFGVLWLLIGVPHRAFKYQLDANGDGKAQCTLVPLLATGASILTGVFILMLHFGGGPLHKLDTRPLIAGIIFTIFLILPGYKSIANACWTRGVKEIFRPRLLVKHWHETAVELDTVLHHRNETSSGVSLTPRFHDQNGNNNSSQQGPSGLSSTPSANSSAAEKTTQETDVHRNAPRQNSTGQTPRTRGKPQPRRSRKTRRR